MPESISAHINAQTQFQPAILAWEMFLNDQGRSPHTVKAFLADLRLLSSYFPPDQSVGSVTTSDINGFLEWMQKHRGVPCSPKTLSRRITSIKAFFRWLTNGGAILVDPAEKVVQKSVMSPTPSVLTSTEVDQILEVAENYRQADNRDLRYLTLVRLLLSTGIKKGECLNLRANHIELTAPTGPLIFIRYANPQHRYKERKISLPDDWVEVFHEYKNAHEITERVFPWSPRRLEYLLEDLSDGAGIGKHLSFDMCRWTCALTDCENGIEPDKIRQKLGISKVQWREVKMKLRRLSGNDE
jgi:integrase/recombinase XerD